MAIGKGTDTIVDFQVGIDTIELADGLSSEELSIVKMGSHIEMGLGSETLAVINGIDVNHFIESNPFA